MLTVGNRNVYFFSTALITTKQATVKNQKRSTVTGCEDAYLNIIMFKIHRNYSPQRREIDSKQYFSPPHTV